MATTDSMPSADRGLIGHGAVMILLGLVSGLSAPFARAPRAALEAHTIGLLRGALLFGLAAIWRTLGRARPVVKAARYCALIEPPPGQSNDSLGLSGAWFTYSEYLH